MFLLRVSLPDRPGALGAVASAVGDAGCDIRSITIVEEGPSHSIDDFIIDMPTGMLPDSLVSACQRLEDVQVLWISRHYGQRAGLSDLQTLKMMTSDPAHAAEVLVDAAPTLFHCQWAVLGHLAEEPRVTYATAMAPDLDTPSLTALGDLEAIGARELAAGWVPGWSDTALAQVPLPRQRVILLGRTGGPRWLESELDRIAQMASLAD